MKKRFSSIASAISAAFIFAACSTDVIDDMASVQTGNPDDNAVTFSTYTAKKGGTRAGDTDYSYMTTAELKKTGFGVFAYSTAGDKYKDFRKGQNSYPNFMYNQKVTYSSGEDWTYTPLKYWPNDFANGDVDLKDPAAQGSGTNGFVSFFAYAPFVTSASETYGITGMTSNSTDGDPKITYTLAPDENGKYIDLLWGTLDPTTGANVVGTPNKGTTGVADKGTGTYEEEVLDGQIVATDLTKQATDKQVKFLFKHALAGIGGSTKTVVTDPDDEEDVESNKSDKSGFLVVLDIDNSTEGETTTGTTDGKRQQFNKETGGSATNSTDGAYYRTIVTIKNITIKNVESTTITKGSDGDGENEEDNTTANGTLYKKGTLNLATGQWDIYGDETDETTKEDDKYEFEQTVGETEESSATSYALNPAIAEYKEAGTKYFPTIAANTGIPTDDEKGAILKYFEIADNDHTGVTETKLNVYEDADVAPFLLFPGSDPILQVSVEYVVRQYDDALATTYTEITNKITKDVIFPKVKLNTHYTLVMHLGLTSVKFTATVSQWDEYDNPDDDESTTPGEDEKRDDGIEVGSGFGEIYLPSNVVSTDTKETTTVTTTTQD